MAEGPRASSRSRRSYPNLHNLSITALKHTEGGGEAAKAAIERTTELGEGAAYIWGAVKKIYTPDELTLEFQLSYPSPLDLVSSGTYSAYIYDTEAAAAEAAAQAAMQLPDDASALMDRLAS